MIFAVIYLVIAIIFLALLCKNWPIEKHDSQFMLVMLNTFCWPGIMLFMAYQILFNRKSITRGRYIFKK